MKGLVKVLRSSNVRPFFMVTSWYYHSRRRYGGVMIAKAPRKCYSIDTTLVQIRNKNLIILLELMHL